MKKILLFSKIFLSATLMNAQDYNPIIEDGNKWNVLRETYGLNPVPNQATFTYAVGGDTIINEKVFRKLFFSDEEEPTQWILDWAIREETDKKVYAWSFAQANERLLYDFAALAGDTISIFPDAPEIIMVVDSVTSIEITGSMRPIHWLSVYFSGGKSLIGQETWIEGIGSNKGILGSGTSALVGSADWLLCKWENDQLIYMNTQYNKCYIVTKINEASIPDPLQIRPNPATNEVWLQLPDNLPFSQLNIELFCRSGRLLYRAQPTSRLHRIETAHLPPALYLVQLWDGKHWKSEKLIIK
jgi:hypothetical protein